MLCLNMQALVVVVVAMSALRQVWEPRSPQAAPATKVKGWKRKIEMEEEEAARPRSPRRRFGAKAMLKSWAKGDSSACTVWKLCHAIVTEDGTDAGHGMSRLAQLGSASSGSEKLLAEIKRPTG